MINLLRVLTAPLLICTSMLVTQPASAVPVQDQSDTVISRTAKFQGFGETFTAGLSGILSSVAFIIPSAYFPNDAGTANVSIYSGDSLSQSNLIATKLISEVLTSDGYSMDTSSLNVSVTAGSVYTFYLTAKDQLPFYASVDATNSYAGGSVWLSGAHGLATEDLAFRTSVDDGSVSVVEPASIAILAVGFAGATAIRRRRRLG